MPVAVFLVGCVFHTESFSWPVFANMILVTIGVAVASYGEINFNVVGVMFQMGAIVSESIRLVLVQILLQVGNQVPSPVPSISLRKRAGQACQGARAGGAYGGEMIHEMS